MKNLRSLTHNSSHFPNLLLKLETNRPLLKAINSTLIGLKPINLSAASYSNSIVRPAPLKPLPCLPLLCTGMQCDGAVRCRAGGLLRLGMELRTEQKASTGPQCRPPPPRALPAPSRLWDAGLGHSSAVPVPLGWLPAAARASASCTALPSAAASLRGCANPLPI